MRRLIAFALVGLSALALPRPAAAGASTDAALALGAFAVLNQLVRGETILHGVVGRPAPMVVHTPPPVVYAPPPRVVYAPPRVVYAPPPRVVYAPPRVIYAPPPVVVHRARPPVVAHRPPVVAHRAPVVAHPHGRWVRSRGHWVWVATPAPYHPRHRR